MSRLLQDTSLRKFNCKMERDSHSNISNKLMPHNSLSDLINGKSSDQQCMTMNKDYCQKCYDLHKNIEHLEGYLRNSILRDPCSSCSTCLSFLQFMKQTMEQQERSQRMQQGPLNTPVLTKYFMLDQPARYMNHYQQHMIPGFASRMVPRKSVVNPPWNTYVANTPRVVQLPIAGKPWMNMQSRRAYSMRAHIRRQTATSIASDKTKATPKSKVASTHTNFSAVQSTEKKMKKKRVTAVKPNESPIAKDKKLAKAK